MSSGEIHIRGLRVRTRIGVPDEERAEWQELLIDVVMMPATSFAEMNDQIATTIDYHAVCLAIGKLAEAGERRLIETLANEIAELVLRDHSAVRVEVVIRKFILPQTEWVGVRLIKDRG